MSDPVRKNVVEIHQSTNTVTVASSGPQGPTGATGATGPKGDSGGSYTHEQQVESSQWNITHNLGYRPSVTVQDYGKIVIEGELDHLDANNLKIIFSSAISGYAYLS